jgi:predicted O-methyltransferase YrrM
MNNIPFINKLTEKYISEILDSPKTDSSHLEMIIFSIASSLKAKTIVELGVRGGGTTTPLLMASNLNEGILHSIDLNEINYQCPQEFVKNWICHSKTDSLDFLKSWPKNEIIDLVYIDDWHSYDHVKLELEILDTLISPKSIILLHDLMYGNWQPHYHCDIAIRNGQWANGGPYRAVAELNQNFWEFSTIPINNGLTVLRKKYSNKYHI